MPEKNPWSDDTEHKIKWFLIGMVYGAICRYGSDSLLLAAGLFATAAIGTVVFSDRVLPSGIRATGSVAAIAALAYPVASLMGKAL